MALSAGKNVPYRLLHVGVIRVAKIAQSSGEVRRADEDAVNSLHGADSIEVFHAETGLDLYEHANLIVHAGEVVGHGAIAVAALRHRYTSDASGRVACGGHCPLGFLRGFHERN